MVQAGMVRTVPQSERLVRDYRVRMLGPPERSDGQGEPCDLQELQADESLSESGSGGSETSSDEEARPIVRTDWLSRPWASMFDLECWSRETREAIRVMMPFRECEIAFATGAGPQPTEERRYGR
jgi:hypothetical protein